MLNVRHITTGYGKHRTPSVMSASVARNGVRTFRSAVHKQNPLPPVGFRTERLGCVDTKRYADIKQDQRSCGY